MSQQSQPPFDTFKPRELEVLRLIADGRTNQEIAAHLMIEVTTVRWHNRQIYSKLGVHSRTLMIARARELGLLETEKAQRSSSTLPSGPTQPRHPSNLPAQTTTFIGREREIAKARELLTTSRLLTLTGPGGSGKTRLALQLARVVSDEYADGIWFVPLVSVHEARLLPNAIAGVLQIAENTTETIDTSLVQYLRDKQMLLVIDNFEHVINGASLLATLLAEAPMLTLIVTSREVLRLYGEQEYPVPPLTMPDREIPYSAQELIRFEAVRLFVARAQASHPAFQITNSNVQVVAEICVRLDGLPLAIELAAARIKLFSPLQLLTRLASGLGTLGQGPRDAPARQRTLRATIDWSYNLLNEVEKALLSQLGVFQGGWTLQAMEAVCGSDLHFNLFDALNALIDKSLVQTADDFARESSEEVASGELNEELNREPRFKLLESVREYALERLPAGEAEVLQRRHRDFFLELAERGEKGLETDEAQLWYEGLRIEEGNLVAALDWCRKEAGEAQAGLRLAGALWHYWHVRGILREGRAWLALFLQRAEAGNSLARARALNGAGMLAYRQGEYAEVTRLCGEALAIGASLGESGTMAFALHYLAHVAQEQGNYAEAEEMLTRSMTLYSKLANEWGYGETLNCLGDLHRQLGNFADAVAMLEQALVLRRQLKDRRGIATTLYNLGNALCRQNEAAHATLCFRQSLEISQALNNQLMSVICILGFAQAAGVQGDAQRAARLLSAAHHLLEDVGYRLEPSDRADYEWLLARLRAELDESTFGAAWGEGAKMSFLEVVAYL